MEIGLGGNLRFQRLHFALDIADVFAQATQLLDDDIFRLLGHRDFLKSQETEAKSQQHPYEEFKAELSEWSQLSLEMDYKSTSFRGGMIVFVRDNMERKLVSYVMNIDASRIPSIRRGRMFV